MTKILKIARVEPRFDKENTHLYVLEVGGELDFELEHSEVDVIAAAAPAPKPTPKAPVPLHYYSGVYEALAPFDMYSHQYNTILTGEAGVAIVEMIPSDSWLRLGRADCIALLRKGRVVTLAFDPETNEVTDWMQCEGFALGQVGVGVK